MKRADVWWVAFQPAVGGEVRKGRLSYIQFELTEESHKWIRRELGNITLRDIGRRMYEHVAAGGEIDEQTEAREDWSSQHEFHHDIRLSIKNKLVYIETRLNYRVPVAGDDSWVKVVNIHEC